MLFGHQNDSTQPSVPAATQPDNVNPLAVDPATGASLPVAPTPPSSQFPPSEPSVLNQPSTSLASDDTATAPVVEPAAPSVSEPLPAAEPAASVSAPAAAEPLDVPPAPAPAAPAAPAGDELLALKQQALEQLSPLVGHLDQTPEERFRTTMMMIQSTDNQALLPDAYAAAQSIEDEKARAQALLDVINEINYFTQAKPAA